MKNEVEQIALQNDMSIEFVTWFFNEKKVGCGNVWFMMMAAMWEGWKGRSIEMDKLATENVALKNVFSQKEIPSEAVDAFMETAVMDHDWNETSEWSWVENETEVIHAVLDALKPETPATDRIVAEAEARGVEKAIAHLEKKFSNIGVQIMNLQWLADSLREGREMSIATYLNTGLAILGWAYIMVKTGQWITKNALRQWDKRRKESRRQKAVNEFYDAFELNSLEPGSTVRLATKGDLTIMMFRSEGADK